MDQMFTGPGLEVAAWLFVIVATGWSVFLLGLGIFLLRRRLNRRRVAVAVRVAAVLAVVAGLVQLAALTTLLFRSGGV